MKNNQDGDEIKPISEIEIPGVCGRLMHWISHIRPIVWLVVTAVALAVFVIVMPQSMWYVLWKGMRAQKYLMFLLAVLSLIAISLIWSTGQRIDVWFFMFVNKRGQHPPWLDWVMLGYTQIGSGIFAYSVALVLFLRPMHMLAYELIFGNLTLWLMVELLKVLINRTRPYSKLEGIRIIGHREGGRSFPSGHTSQAFFMASLFAHYFSTGVLVTILLYIVAALVGVTRIYVGMHYPRDVLGGAVLGTAWGLVGVILNSYIFSELGIH
ncbi:MAG: phosphatase PAP2 family protein [Clostridia bacterium]|nr:phosphatase PAP2 family protein [Clostridia bacterium]